MSRSKRFAAIRRAAGRTRADGHSMPPPYAWARRRRRLFETLHPQQPQHPTYLAFAELGKAIKTIFLCRYVHSVALRREIQEGLNVIETWNGANSFILYGKGGEIATNDWTQRMLPGDLRALTRLSTLT
jgi:TnpA family transposase